MKKTRLFQQYLISLACLTSIVGTTGFNSLPANAVIITNITCHETSDPSGTKFAVDICFFTEPANSKHGLPTLTLTETFFELGPHDVRIKVRGMREPGDPQGTFDDPILAMIGIDKRVRNQTEDSWRDFHFTLGLPGPFDTGGVGEKFRKSPQNDNIFFKESPAPVDVTGTFRLDPDMPFDHRPKPDAMWFDLTTESNPLEVGDFSLFWFGLQVSLVEVPPFGTFDDNFVLRQEATKTPESSSSLSLLVLGVLGTSSVVFRHNKQ